MKALFIRDCFWLRVNEDHPVFPEGLLKFNLKTLKTQQKKVSPNFTSLFAYNGNGQMNGQRFVCLARTLPDLCFACRTCSHINTCRLCRQTRRWSWSRHIFVRPRSAAGLGLAPMRLPRHIQYRSRRFLAPNTCWCSEGSKSWLSDAHELAWQICVKDLKRMCV